MGDNIKSFGTTPANAGYPDPQPLPQGVQYEVTVAYKDLRQQPRSRFEASSVSVIGPNYVIFFPDGERLEIHRSNVDSLEVVPLTSCCGSNADWKVHLEFKDCETGENLTGVESFRRTGNEYRVQFSN